ncbi:MAG TPA: hypothetical protein VF403_26635, partial [Kofleriaceae bacterium]
MRIAPSCIVAFAIMIATPLPASAQTAEAETLFREGKRLIKKGKIAEACEKFEASERLEPKIGTELNLANCREKNGQTSSAWAMFALAAGNAKSAGIEDSAAEARKRASALQKKLIYLTIVVPPESAFDDLVIKRNQTSIDRALWNQAVPVDPNEYTIAAEGPDHKSWSVTIAVKTKSKVVEVPKLEPTEHRTERKPDDTTVGSEPTKPARTDPDDARTPPPKRPEPPRKYKSTVILLGAIGAGAVVIATGFGLYANHVESLSDEKCPPTMMTCTDAHAVDLNSTARTDGWIANISWGVGTVALAGAFAAWWLGSPAQQNDTVSLVPIVGRDRTGVVLE